MEKFYIADETIDGNIEYTYLGTVLTSYGEFSEKILSAFRAAWGSLTQAEQDERKHFRLVEGEFDEDGRFTENYTEFSFK